MAAEAVDGLSDQLFHPVFHNLLTFGDEQVIRKVLTHGRVGGGREADNRPRTRMTHVDANQHGLHLGEAVRELHCEEVAAHFAVDLPEDV